MSEYQKLKARAQAAQQAREREIQLDLEAKAEKEKQKRREEEERRKRQEAESRAARTLELKKANEAINKGKQSGNGLEYDPFAEEERRPTPAVPSHPAVTKAKHASSKPSGSGGSASRQTKLIQDIPRPPMHNSGSGSKAKVTKTEKKEASPPALGRKEQAARAMMASVKRSAGATSVFSVRPPISNGHGVGAAKSGSSSPAPLRVPPVKSPMKQTTLGKRGKQQGSHGEMRALCPDRTSRDQRTIDEIQRDIKARKNVPSTSTSTSRSPLPDRNRIAPPSTKGRPGSSRPTARQRSPSTSSSSSSSSDDVPARKRSRPETTGNKPNISSMIQDIFRRPGRPAPRQYDSDSDGSDMEAGYSDVEEEERRAVRIARREDEIAEKEERERKEKKERLRKERERGIGK